jgi:hypothetical protein
MLLKKALKVTMTVCVFFDFAVSVFLPKGMGKMLGAVST